MCDVRLAGERSRGSAHLLRTVRPVLSSTVCQRQGRGRRSIVLKWVISQELEGFLAVSWLLLRRDNPKKPDGLKVTGIGQRLVA
jgi:hypothetical protein